MCVPNTCEPHVELATDVFKTQSKELVNSLKDFLTFLPSPNCVEKVLTVALHQLAETDPDACRWLLRNSYYLEPELDVVGLAMKFAFTKLNNQGLMLGQDFSFEPNGRLDVSEKAKAQLMIGNSACDRLLIEEILQIRD